MFRYVPSLFNYNVLRDFLGLRQFLCDVKLNQLVLDGLVISALIAILIGAGTVLRQSAD